MVSTNENDSLSRQSSLSTCVPLVSSSRHNDDDVSDGMSAVTVVALACVNAVRNVVLGANEFIA